MFCKITYRFTHHDGHTETMDVIREFRYPAEARIFADADAEAARRIRPDEFKQVDVIAVAPVKLGKTWKVTMEGVARHSTRGTADISTVIFADAEDPYDAEQVAYRTWERQVRESGFERLSIWRTIVGSPVTDETVNLPG